MLPKGKRIPGPYYDLAAFQDEVEVKKWNVHVYKTRALNVIQQLRQCTQYEARAFARRAVLSLTADDYAHTVQTPTGQVQDVYGKMIHAEGWYVKIEIQMEDGQPGIVSCHPAEHDLVTKGGIVPQSRNLP
jgi:UDP-galactopyranose mutase